MIGERQAITARASVASPSLAGARLHISAANYSAQIAAFLIDTLPIRITPKCLACIIGAHSNRHSPAALKLHQNRAFAPKLCNEAKANCAAPLWLMGDVLGDAEGVYGDFEAGVVEQVVSVNIGEADANEPVVKIGKLVEFLQLVVACMAGAFRGAGHKFDGDKMAVLHVTDEEFVALIDFEAGEGSGGVNPTAGDLENVALRVLIGERGCDGWFRVRAAARGVIGELHDDGLLNDVLAAVGPRRGFDFRDVHHASCRGSDVRMR
jgi:hypothetical protein